MRDDKQGLLRLAAHESLSHRPRGPLVLSRDLGRHGKASPPTRSQSAAVGPKEPGDDAAPSPSPSHESDNRQRGSPPRATLNWLGHFSQGVLVALPGCPQDRLHDLGSPVKSTALSHTVPFREPRITNRRARRWNHPRSTSVSSCRSLAAQSGPDDLQHRRTGRLVERRPGRNHFP